MVGRNDQGHKPQSARVEWFRGEQEGGRGLLLYLKKEWECTCTSLCPTFSRSFPAKRARETLLRGQRQRLLPQRNGGKAFPKRAFSIVAPQYGARASPEVPSRLCSYRSRSWLASQGGDGKLLRGSSRRTAPVMVYNASCEAIISQAGPFLFRGSGVLIAGIFRTGEGPVGRPTGLTYSPVMTDGYFFRL